MRIALRTSGGRGDYELAGRYGKIGVGELLDKNFSYQLSPGMVLNGFAAAHRLSGKPRIRPEGDGEHAYKILGAVLLLPTPMRELRKTGTSNIVLRDRAFAVTGIDVDVLPQQVGANTTFAPTAIWVTNTVTSSRIDFPSRMAAVNLLWNAADISKHEAAPLLRAHRDAVEAGAHPGIMRAATDIQKYFDIETDVLPLLLSAVGLSGVAVGEDVPDLGEVPAAAPDNEDDDTPPEESARDRVFKWRKQAVRGAEARAFSVNVRKAYGHRCVFSGEALPKFDEISSSGVDGAHILPWATHNLNNVINGLCLCKLCHWAFDTGIFKFDFDPKGGSYLLSVPKKIEKSARAAHFDIDPFVKLQGAIPVSRLPSKRVLWPSQTYIATLNKNLYG